MAGLFQNVKGEDSYEQYFEDGTKIASGGFGVVSPVINRKTGKVVAAIKRTNLENRDERLVDYSRKEASLFHPVGLNKFKNVTDFLKIEMMQGFCHRNIARLFASYTENNGLKVVTIMEMCQTDLKMYVESRKYVPLPADTVLDWCSQMVCGLKYLHDKGIIHRDLKPAVNLTKINLKKKHFFK